VILIDLSYFSACVLQLLCTLFFLFFSLIFYFFFFSLCIVCAARVIIQCDYLIYSFLR